jgi:hypothetical protein
MDVVSLPRPSKERHRGERLMAKKAKKAAKKAPKKATMK